MIASISLTLSSLFVIACAGGPESAHSIDMSPAPATVACEEGLTLPGGTHCTPAPGVALNKGKPDTTTPGLIVLPTQEFDGSAAGVQIGGAGSPPPTPQPSLSLAAAPPNVAAGQESRLIWSASNVDWCDASLGWSGRKPASGFENTGPLDENTSFRLDCDGPFGRATQTVTVGITGGQPVPTLSLTAQPLSIEPDQSSTLTWSSQNASTCTASGAWSGSTSTSGSESTGALTENSTFNLTCEGAGGTVSDSVTVTVASGPLSTVAFARNTIDEDRGAWGKNFADINGDGFLDIIEGGGSIGENVYWYRYPDWQRFQIGTTSGGDDIQAGDIDGDGALDVVVNAAPISWYRNPAGAGGNPEAPWTRHSIATHRSHDIALADFNEDGKLDVALRMAGPGANPSTRIYLQASASSWIPIALRNGTNGTGGLALLDVDRDGKLDVIGDGYWLRHPDANITDGHAWLNYPIGEWPAGSSIASGDINNDGRIDITMAASEVGVGDLTWFEAPVDPLTQPWIRHNIDLVEDVHRHHVVDFNQDGQLDILMAEMYQSGTDRVGIYYNEGNGAGWVLHILETHASHNLAVGDIGNDGDIDFVGANWRRNAPAGGDLFLWENQTY